MDTVYNSALCLAIIGYGGTHNPVRLHHCNQGTDQNVREVQNREAFELPSKTNKERGLSKHHHPKSPEVVFPERCEKTRRFDTTHCKSY